MSQIINGKEIAQGIRERVRERVSAHTQAVNRPPFLAVVLMGDDPASKIYVGHKERACAATGIRTKTWYPDKDTSEADLLELIQDLNQNPEIDGILVQLPLPEHIDKKRIISAIDPVKDVDGLTPKNQGLLALGLPSLVPCTPLGIMELIRSTGMSPKGKTAAVIGRSPLVGSPVSALLNQADATVIQIHSKTREPWKYCRQADILVAAAGVPGLVKKDWIAKGSVVIDVGIHKDSHGKLRGDVDFEAVKEIACHITPVPGGVGPTTIAFLLANCLKAYEWRLNGDNPYHIY